MTSDDHPELVADPNPPQGRRAKKKAKQMQKLASQNLMDTEPPASISRKRLEHMERKRKREEDQVSKKRKKELARIASKKERKDTRDALIEQLLQYQLKAPAEKPTKSDKRKEKRATPSRRPPKKLRCVDAAESASSRRMMQKQANYYETDESSGEEYEAAQPDNAMEVGSTASNDANTAEIAMEVDSATSNEANAAESTMEVFRMQREKEVKERTLAEAAERERRTQVYQTQLEALAKIKGVHVAVLRTSDIEALRMKLPVHAEEQPIVEAVNENPIVIICGETGSGKTTQLPQFLFEAGYTSNGHLIGVTEPRRVAAISMSTRVGQELNDSRISSYQIRFEGNRSDATKILFMTDGVLLRELQHDATLSRFSVIIVDEAHERSIYTDVLIGLLTRICMARHKRGYPLKLVIMSATLRLEDFLQKRLFPVVTPRVLKVESRQYPVTMHYERRTPDDYLRAVLKKVCRIHERLPAGGILVFLSGQREVEQLIKWLRTKYPPATAADDRDSRRRGKKGKATKRSDQASTEAGEVALADYNEFGVDDVDYERTFFAEDESFDEEIPDELAQDASGGDEDNDPSRPLHCLPLYSLLPSAKQQLVFQPPPDGSRLCVVATNVAETSLTIPNIRYVVDSGREKRRRFDPITGVSQFTVSWISQASASQRAGRAGRVQAGHAYRLYSSAVYEDFVKFSSPEILNKPIEQLVLHLKAMNFSKLANFPFPTPPETDQLEEAEKRLERLGALKRDCEGGEASVTELGRTLVQIPLSPPFAKLLVLSNQHQLLPAMITLVSALSVREPMVRIGNMREEGSSERTQQVMADLLKLRRKWCNFGEARDLGDLSVILHALGAVDHEEEVTEALLKQLGIHSKAVAEIRRLRAQLAQLLNTSQSVEEKFPDHFKLAVPTQKQMRFIRQVFTACLPDQIAMRVVDSATPSGDAREQEGKVPKHAYKTQRLVEYVFIDSSSILYRDRPDYVLYQEVIQIGEKKCMQTIMAVDEEWLPDFVKARFKFAV